jgi:hypothetical protein
LVEGWLTSLGFRSVRLWERRGTISTYEAQFGDDPLALPARVRVHQRLRQLEITHVESFLGHLVRSGNPIGILVTPGECSWAAGLGARTPKLPFLRLLGGAEWSEELRAAREKEASRRREAQRLVPKEEDHRPRCQHDADPTKVPCGTCRGEWRGGYRIW